MKKAVLIIPILLALLAIPAVSAYESYQGIGQVTSFFIDTYGSSHMTLKEMPEEIHFKDMTFKLVMKDKYMTRYEDTEKYYRAEIWTTNGKVGFFDAFESTYGNIGYKQPMYYIDWSYVDFTEKQFKYHLLTDDTKKRIRVISDDTLYEVIRLRSYKA